MRQEILSFNSFPVWDEILLWKRLKFLTYLEKGKEKASNLWTCLRGHRALQKIVSSTLLSINDERRLNCPESYKKARLKEFLWIADLTCSKQEDIPMWIGWNARQTIKKQNTLQKVWYFSR